MLDLVKLGNLAVPLDESLYRVLFLCKFLYPFSFYLNRLCLNSNLLVKLDISSSLLIHVLVNCFHFFDVFNLMGILGYQSQTSIGSFLYDSSCNHDIQCII